MKILLVLALLCGPAAADPDDDGAWATLDRIAAVAAVFHDSARPFNTPLRPRDLIVGDVDLACERQEGRPCGDGANLFTELDAAAGYRGASIATRLRAAHTPHGFDLAIDRLHVDGALGPFRAEVGRDVILLGPASRTQLGWGTNAPPLDHVRVSTRPLVITDDVAGSLLYLVGRLRDPQTYPGNLVTIARGQLDIAGAYSIGMMQLLQLAGDGAPGFGVWDFIREHITRRDASATATDSSNRRIGFDLAARIGGLHDARLYYQLVFEDWRKRFVDAVRYDADHLFGVDVARHGFTFEIMKTGVRSEEHTPRLTGFTNAGRIVGAPLGPDAISAFASERVELRRGTLVPWVELARLSSDTYTFVGFGGISRTTEGPAERRYRGGIDLLLPVRRDLELGLDAMYEYVTSFAFDPSTSRTNVGVTATLVWRPNVRLGGN